MSTPDLSGRVALVTGASRGIGAAAALVLARAGAHIVAVARTVGGLEALDDEIKAVGGSATLVPVSVTDYEGVDRLGAALHERFGKLDVLVGNAGILGPLSPLGHVDPKQMGQCHRRQCHGELAADPLDGPASAPLRCGAGDLHDLRRREQYPRLLGTLFGVEGRARRAGPHLCRRDADHPDPRQSPQSRCNAHQDARAGHAGRGSA